MAESHRHLLLLFDSDIMLHSKGLIQVQWFTANFLADKLSLKFDDIATRASHQLMGLLDTYSLHGYFGGGYINS
jgi:hypothetical protein